MVHVLCFLFEHKGLHVQYMFMYMYCTCTCTCTVHVHVHVDGSYTKTQKSMELDTLLLSASFHIDFDLGFAINEMNDFRVYAGYTCSTVLWGISNGTIFCIFRTHTNCSKVKTCKNFYPGL